MGIFFLLGILLMPRGAFALSWTEPSCDPATDPTACNVAAPINVSSADQTKAGSLTISSTLNAGSLNVTGISTFGGALTANSSATFTNAFTYSGLATSFSLTADSIDDSEVSNTLTASIFQRGVSSTDAVDLDTSEVAGTLPSGSVSDVWVNTSGDSMSGGLSIVPTSAVTALAITPWTTNRGIEIIGQTGEALISLAQSSSSGFGLLITQGASASGDAINISMSQNSSGRGIQLASSSSTSGAYVIDASSTGSVSRTINVTNSATSGTSVYAASSGTGSYGVIGIGRSSGLYGVGAATAAGAIGVYGITAASGGYAVRGDSTHATSGYGGYFTAAATSGSAIYAGGTGSSGVTVNVTDAKGIQVTTSSSTADATGITVTTTGGQKGIDVDATAVGLDVTVPAYYEALEANSGTIRTRGAYRGGQFYPNEASSSEHYANIIPRYVSTASIGTAGASVSDLLFDGSTVWIAFDVALGPSFLTQQHLRDGHQMDSTTMSWGDSGTLVLIDDTIYHFSDSGYYDMIDRFEGNWSGNILSASPTILSATFDGESIWFGTNNTIREWDNLTTLSTRVSGLGTIYDILYADGYIWAADNTNDLVYKVDTSTYAKTNITVGDQPRALVYDGQFVWAANYGGNSITRINVADSSTETYSVSTLGTAPTSLAFDGVNIWIGFNSTGIGAFNVAEEATGKANSLVGAAISHLTFDGTYLWATSTDNYLFKIAVGRGYDEHTDGLTDGILIYNTSGEVRCLYVSGTTVTASSTLTNCQ